MNETRTYQRQHTNAPAEMDNPFIHDAVETEQRLAAFEQIARAAREATARGEAARHAPGTTTQSFGAVTER